MRHPCDLPETELLQIVQSIQRLLYLDEDDDRQRFWNPDKSWNGADVCQSVAAILGAYDLVPGTSTSLNRPAAHSHKKGDQP